MCCRLFTEWYDTPNPNCFSANFVTSTSRSDCYGSKLHHFSLPARPSLHRKTPDGLRLEDDLPNTSWWSRLRSIMLFTNPTSAQWRHVPQVLGLMPSNPPADHAGTTRWLRLCHPLPPSEHRARLKWCRSLLYPVHAAVAAVAWDEDKSQSINTGTTTRSQQVVADRQSYCASECPSAISAETRAAKLVSFWDDIDLYFLPLTRRMRRLHSAELGDQLTRSPKGRCSPHWPTWCGRCRLPSSPLIPKPL